MGVGMSEGHEALFDQARFAQFVHGHLERTIGQFDLKVTILAGFTWGAVVFLLQELNILAPAAGVGLSQLLAFPQFAELNPASIPLYLKAAALLAFAVAFASEINCIRPRSVRPSAESLSFFGAIARQTAPDFISAVTTRANEDLVASVLGDAHSLARIANRKALWAGLATQLTMAGAALWGAGLLIEALNR